MSEDAHIRSIEPARVAGGLGERVLSAARYAVDEDRDVVAYGMVVMYKDGATMVGANCDFPDDLPYLNRYIFLQLCSERLREHLITDRTAADIVNQALGYAD